MPTTTKKQTAQARDRVQAHRLRKLARPRTAAEDRWLARYDKEHPAPERVSKRLEREEAEAPSATVEVHTGPPTPSITAPPRANDNAQDAPPLASAGATPPEPPPANDNAPQGLPPLPGDVPPPPALPPIGPDHRIAKLASGFYRAGAVAWGRILRAPAIGETLETMADAYGIAAAELYREKMGDGPLDRNKMLIAGTVIASGGLVEPFVSPKKPAEQLAQVDEEQTPPPETVTPPPTSPTGSTAPVEEMSEDARIIPPIGRGYGH